jgi:AraC family transcriptional regulator, regulatory protein of adaptative response / DNA-3-methyladenine glycosylase II
VDLDRTTCDRARQSRDARFDGRFFIAVTSTGIYCRPICPARSPRPEHILYFPSAAAAAAAGFRPCLRCRPEASPGTPAWLGSSAVVSRGLRLIGEGALDEDGVEALADRLGVTGRHLRRLFLQHLGATPLEIALTRRVHFAKRLLDETDLAIQEVAFASGFGSLRRFNGQMRASFRRAPRELRKLGRRPIGAEPHCYRFCLAYRPPYDWSGVLLALASEGPTYQRSFTIDDKLGTIEVANLEGRASLLLEVRYPEPRHLLGIVERVRRLFDLGADPLVIGRHLRADPLLRTLVAKHPGIRVPGCWEPALPGSRVEPAQGRFGEPDALRLPDGALLRVAGSRSAAEFARRAEAWRPWRAYAIALLLREQTPVSETRRDRHRRSIPGSPRSIAAPRAW